MSQHRSVSFELNHSQHSIDSVDTCSTVGFSIDDNEFSSSMIHCEIVTLPPLDLSDEEKSNLWYTRHELDQLRREEVEEQKKAFMESSSNSSGNKVSAVKQRLQEKRRRRQILSQHRRSQKPQQDEMNEQQRRHL